jgi:hypothetical protein
MFLTSKIFWKRFFTVSAIVLGVFLIVFVILNVWISSRLESRLAKLRAAGEPTSIRELERPVPTESNAALILAEVRSQLEAFAKAQMEFEKTAAGMNYAEFGYLDERPSDEQIAAIKELVEKFPDLPTAIDHGGEAQNYIPPMDYSLDHLAFQDEVTVSMKLLRTVSRFNSLRVALAMTDGKLDDAANVGINMLKLAKLNDSQPLLVSGLVGIALRGAAIRELNRVLRAGELSPETYLRIDQELAVHDDPQRIVEMLKTERAFNLDSAYELTDHFSVGWIGNLLKLDILEFHEQAVPILAKPWHENKSKLRSLSSQRYVFPISDTAMSLMLPALQAANEANQRGLAELRCLRMLNALKSLQQSSGSEAKDFADLGLIESATLDPFSGEPLILKKVDNGWVIYSVMQNGKDDGGNFKDYTDWGVAPVGYPNSN